MDRGGRHPDARRAVRKALGVRGERGIESVLARGTDDLNASMEDVGGREEGEARSSTSPMRAPPRSMVGSRRRCCPTSMARSSRPPRSTG